MPTQFIYPALKNKRRTEELLHKRDKSQRVARILATDKRLERRAYRMEHCSDIVEEYTDTRTGEMRLVIFDPCKDRLCDTCKGVPWRTQGYNQGAIESVLREHEHVDVAAVTFSPPTVLASNTRAQIERLNKGFGYVLSHEPFKYSLIGHVWAAEITRAADGKSHPHLHATLLLQREAVDVSKIGEHFQAATGLRQLQTDCRYLTGEDDHLARWIGYTSQGSIEITEEMIADPPYIRQMAHQLVKARTCGSGGELRKAISRLKSEKRSATSATKCSNRTRHYANGGSHRVAA